MLVSFLVQPVQSGESWDNVATRIESKKMLGTIHVIKGTANKKGMLGLLDSHVKSLGVPVWYEPRKNGLPALMDDGANGEHQPLLVPCSRQS